MGGYIGARAGTISATVANVQDVTATDTTPEVTIVNSTHEDSDQGREGKVIFKGQQSGGEESTLAEIEAHHHGSSDDEKGSLVIRTNDGNDGASPTTAMIIDSAQNVGIGTASVDVSTQAGGSGYKALQIESDEGGQLNFDHNDAGTGSTLGQINFQRAGEVVAEIEGVTDGATDNGRLAFRTQPDGGALTEVMRIDHDGQITTPANPAFRVYNTGSQTSSGADEIVAWAGEELDRGGNFASNVFTAPVTGVYSFNCQFLSASETAQTTLYIKVGSSTVSYARSSLNASGNHRTTHLNWLGTVTAGTAVGVYISASGTSIYGDASGDWTHFQGVLIG